MSAEIRRLPSDAELESLLYRLTHWEAPRDQKIALMRGEVARWLEPAAPETLPPAGSPPVPERFEQTAEAIVRRLDAKSSSQVAWEIADALYRSYQEGAAAPSVTQEQAALWRKQHLAHCYRGENADGCKYGDADCPAAPSVTALVQQWLEEAKATRKAVQKSSGCYDDFAYAAAKEECAHELEAALKGAPPVRQEQKCWHGHTQRVVGCVSCVLVFDRPAARPVEQERQEELRRLVEQCCRFSCDAESTCRCGAHEVYRALAASPSVVSAPPRLEEQTEETKTCTRNGETEHPPTAPATASTD